MHPQRIALLQGMPIFGAISEPTLDFLVARAVPVAVAAGGCFFGEGDAATGMFVLESGRVVIERLWAGRSVVLGEMGPGDCFGEMALMDLHPRSATVRALADCTALELRPGDLYALFERDCAQFATLQMNMGREVCRRLRHADDLLLGLEYGPSR